MTDVYYFGVIGRPGHFWWAPGPRYVGGRLPEPVFEHANGFDLIDGVYAPKDTPTYQTEGLATVTHVNGWTVLAFWDRSVDTRGGCNSAFVARGAHDFGAMVAKARAAFPSVWERFRFEVRPAAPALAASQTTPHRED